MDFVAIDVETANADLASICQIGIARFKNGELESEWCSLINPLDEFDYQNVAVHGIDEEDVADAPTFEQVSDEITSLLFDSVCVSHTHYDRVAIHRAFQKINIDEPSCAWLDSARVARRTWPDVAKKGYGLANLCNRIGYNFHHHNALEDAKACANVFLAAAKETSSDMDFWLKRVEQPISGSTHKSQQITREGNQEGSLYGESVVFTGSLCITRSDAADRASRAGCSVKAGVSSNTSLLVVGDQDIRRLAGKSISSKHKKAIDLKAKGQEIRILSENDFLIMTN